MSGHDPGAERAASALHISGLPALEYHAMRALSASGAWLLAEECAAKFLWRSPWNPLYAPEAKTEFDIGVAAHLAVLEPARQAEAIVMIEAGDYRTTKARDARDTARAEGKVPLLSYQHDIVQAIAGSIHSHPIAASAFKGGEAEVTLTWPNPETGIACKARPDYLPEHGQWVVDLKTAASANPRSWRDQAYRLGYHARAAWYLDGARARASPGGILVRHRREGSALPRLGDQLRRGRVALGSDRQPQGLPTLRPLGGGE